MTTSVLTRMLNDFPTLLPSAAFFTPAASSPSTPTSCSPLHHYHGYLPVLSTQYRVDLHLRPSPSPPRKPSQPQPRPSLFLSVDAGLQRLLAPHAAVVHQRWLQSADVHAFLLDLKDLITHVLLQSSLLSAPLPLSPAFHAAVVEQLEELGWEHLVAADDDLRSLQLQARDTDGRAHLLTVQLPPSFPSSAPTVTADLPQPLTFAWPSSPSLRALHAHFASTLAALSPYFSALSSIDKDCVVLEPTPPSFAVPYRRVPLLPSLSLLVTLDPLTPYPPTLSFLGPPHLTQPLQALWHRTPHPFLSASGTLVERVQAVLGVVVEKRRGEAAEGTEGMEGGCAICYEARGEEGEALDIQCGDARCGRRYHARCLYAWLSRNVKAAIVFDVCIGACINCEQPISVPVQR